MLLTSAALLARTYWHLQDVEPGFRRDGAVTMTVVLDPGLRGDTGRQRLLLGELQTAVAAVPGVSGAAFVNHLPIGGDLWGITFSRVDRPASNAAERPRASLRVATPAYFETMRIPLLEGRVFTSSDASSEPVILINETSAKRYWPDESPVGRQIQIGALGKEDPKWRVIGIVGDVQQRTLTEPIRPELYFPYSQNPAAEYGMTSLVVHTSVPGDAVIGPVRDAIWNVDETLAVTNVRSMGQILSDSVWQQRFNSMLMGILALLALSLAAVGLFGVVSYAVSRRVREMAIRAAVGARPRDLMTQVLGEGLRMTALGAVLGCVAAYFAAEVLSSLLYGVPTTDWISYVGAATLLTVVSLAASYLPARRAAGLPPTAALRSD